MAAHNVALLLVSMAFTGYGQQVKIDRSSSAPSHVVIRLNSHSNQAKQLARLVLALNSAAAFNPSGPGAGPSTSIRSRYGMADELLLRLPWCSLGRTVEALDAADSHDDLSRVESALMQAKGDENGLFGFFRRIFTPEEEAEQEKAKEEKAAEEAKEAAKEEKAAKEAEAPEETVPEETVIEAVESEKDLVQEAIPEVVDETVSEEVAAVETVPEEKVPEETVKDEPVAEAAPAPVVEAVPEEKVPEEESLEKIETPEIKQSSEQEVTSSEPAASLKKEETEAEVTPSKDSADDAVSVPVFDPKKVRVGIVKSRLHDEIGNELITGIKTAVGEYGGDMDNIVETEVPGSFELPLAAQFVAMSGAVDVIVPVGVLIKSETLQSQVTAKSITRGLMDISMKTGVPIISGVLTAEDDSQARQSSSGENNSGLQWGKDAMDMAMLRQLTTGAVASKGGSLFLDLSSKSEDKDKKEETKKPFGF